MIFIRFFDLLISKGYDEPLTTVAFCDDPLEIEWAETDKLEPVQSSKATSLAIAISVRFHQSSSSSTFLFLSFPGEVYIRFFDLSAGLSADRESDSISSTFPLLSFPKAVYIRFLDLSAALPADRESLIRFHQPSSFSLFRRQSIFDSSIFQPVFLPVASPIRFHPPSSFSLF